MAIVPVRKVTLYGIVDHKEAVLGGLQGLGCVHLENLAPESGAGPSTQEDPREARKALQYLQECPIQRPEVEDSQGFDCAATAARVRDVLRQQQELAEERRCLRSAIDATAPWGDFHLPPEEERGRLRFWFYAVPDERMEAVERTGLAWEVVGRDQRTNYVVVVHADEPAGMPVAPEHLDPRSCRQLQDRLQQVDLELKVLQRRRVELTRWRRLMARALVEAEDQAALARARQRTLDDARVFAVQGWAPRRQLDEIEQFTSRHGLALSIEEPGPEDEPPTLLDNPELLAGGEDAVTFYMTPGYGTWDPSSVTFFSFAAFFAMIISDAGYGLVLGLILLLTWRRLGRARVARRLRILFLAMVLAAVAYGVMAGSYFGVTPGQGSALASLRVLDLDDQGAMMRLSVVIGALHLVLANLITAWQYRRCQRFFASLGWVAIILGGLLAGFRMVGDLVFRWPLDFVWLASGAAAVLFFSSDRPFSCRRFGDLGWRLLDGIKSLAGVSKAFGDVLSYLRLFALGLASCQLAATFNDLAGKTAKIGGMGLLGAILLLVFGHGLNFVLSVMGGVVHGLRLNCIEFFAWSLRHEGRPFQTFCKKASE